MYDLSGKVALVTGTANKKGIGRYIALRLAEEGADVVVSDRDRAITDLDPWDQEEGWRGLESLVAEIEVIGRRVKAITADVTKTPEVDAMVAKAVKEFGGIDILVNNAGLISRFIGLNPMVDMPDEVWDKVIAVNLTGLFHVSRAVAREMIKRNKKGKIINIASIAGKKGMANRCAYSTSKFGVVGLTQIMALELAQYKINVNAVCPGFVATWGPKGAAR
jgi:NAD(P)-dependent dehydrogenase (short-subunit alcohol dehydrogenase family)